MTGSEFGATESVQVDFDEAEVASATTDAAGAFQTTLEVPASALPGPHEVTATGESSGLSTSATFLVRSNWRQFRNGHRHTGYDPYENVLGAANVGHLKINRQARTGQVVYSSPAVVNGVVYAGAESPDNHVYAFDASTGAKLWMVQTGDQIESSPAVVNGVVYIGSDDGKLYALNAHTGGLVGPSSRVAKSPFPDRGQRGGVRGVQRP